LQPFAGYRLQPLPANGIVWWYEDSDRCTKEIFKIFSSITDLSKKIVSARKLCLVLLIIVMISMKHGLEPTFGDTGTKPGN
jgi:hypothetical protein